MTKKLNDSMTRLGRFVLRWSTISDRRMVKSAIHYGLLLTLICLVLGCGKSEKPYSIVPVEGKVTYEDGTPIPGVKVTFVSQAQPLDSKTHPRPGVAGIADDGTIEEVTTYNFGDGLVPGKHKVVVKSSAVHTKYSSAKTTPLIFDTADVPLNITVEKPSLGR